MQNDILSAVHMNALGLGDVRLGDVQARAEALFAEARQDGGWSSLGMPEAGDVNAQGQFGVLVAPAHTDRDCALYYDAAQGRFTAVGDVNGLVGFRFAM